MAARPGRVRSVSQLPDSPQALACVSARRCSVVDASGHELGFDPERGRSVGARPVEVDGGRPLDVIAGATDRSCLAATGRDVLWFDPLSPKAAAVRALPGVVYGVACPSASLCFTVNAGYVFVGRDR